MCMPCPGWQPGASGGPRLRKRACAHLPIRDQRIVLRPPPRSQMGAIHEALTVRCRHDALGYLDNRTGRANPCEHCRSEPARKLAVASRFSATSPPEPLSRVRSPSRMPEHPFTSRRFAQPIKHHLEFSDETDDARAAWRVFDPTTLGALGIRHWRGARQPRWPAARGCADSRRARPSLCVRRRARTRPLRCRER